MRLSGKSILIISPQKWEGQFVSKHHYAIELSKRNNIVFFLEPPKGALCFEIIESKYENLYIVKHGFFFSKKLRFHLRLLYDFLVFFYLKKILTKLPQFDVVWCFEPNLYSKLDWFKAKFKIYHPVDYISEAYQLNVGKSADIIFSVAKNILDQINGFGVPAYLINHGLSSLFVERSLVAWKRNDKLQFAYVGNLCIKGLDLDSLLLVISKYPEIQFVFYGNYHCSDHKRRNFINFLENQNNVSMKGLVSPELISKELANYDGYIVCYNPLEELNSASNSHKILEYLSAGRVIVSNRISYYEDSDLIEMASMNDNSDYISVFDKVINNIAYYNTYSLMNKRRQFALLNSYSCQIDKIENKIRECVE